jgi:flagellar protein FliO/FliZ
MQISSVVMALAALAVVLGLVWLAQFALRQGAAAGLRARLAGGGRLALVQSLALDQRRRVHLLACDGRCVVLLTGGTQDVVVGWLPLQQEPPA